jgi:hypothetical protein
MSVEKMGKKQVILSTKLCAVEWVGLMFFVTAEAGVL